MVNKYFEGKVPEYNGTPNEVDKEFEEFTNIQIKKVEEQIEKDEKTYTLDAMRNYIKKIINK